MIWLALALVIDRLIGDPPWLWQRWGHPVVWFGGVISSFEKLRERGKKSVTFDLALGVLLLVAFAALAFLADRLVQGITALSGMVGWGLHVLVIVAMLAQKSLVDHVRRVADGLGRSLAEGRASVAMIVGRDVTKLDETGVSAAAIESLAENASDGIIAPALWYAIGSLFGFGLAGIIFYKMVNTADSMIGHRTENYLYFGKPAARLDDVMNWPAARLMAGLVVLASMWNRSGSQVRSLIAAIARDARHHRSPNAGWPETAFALVLDVRLGGPRAYGPDEVDGVWLNKAGRVPRRDDISVGLTLFNRCCVLLLLLVILAAIANIA